jgi:hypothetical protein
MKFAILLLSGAMLSGCVGAPGDRTIIFLDNPRTQEVRECRVDEGTALSLRGAVEACAVKYERFGYIPIGTYLGRLR